MAGGLLLLGCELLLLWLAELVELRLWLRCHLLVLRLLRLLHLLLLWLRETLSPWIRISCTRRVLGLLWLELTLLLLLLRRLRRREEIRLLSIYRLQRGSKWRLRNILLLRLPRRTEGIARLLGWCRLCCPWIRWRKGLRLRLLLHERIPTRSLNRCRLLRICRLLLWHLLKALLWLRRLPGVRRLLYRAMIHRRRVRVYLRSGRASRRHREILKAVLQCLLLRLRLQERIPIIVHRSRLRWYRRRSRWWCRFGFFPNLPRIVRRLLLNRDPIRTRASHRYRRQGSRRRLRCD